MNIQQSPPTPVSKPTKISAKTFVVTEAQNKQRIDNFLLRYLSQVPKSRIYKSIRKGEVRVNGKRIKPLYKLKINDYLRIPPLQPEKTCKQSIASPYLLTWLDQSQLYENEDIMILNKPSGLSVHGGSGIQMGIIEALKQKYGTSIELAHRLDRETSGCLIIAKKRDVLKQLHSMLVEHKIKKKYLALLKGHLTQSEYPVNLPLDAGKEKAHKTMKVHPEGKPAQTFFRPLKQFSQKNCTLVEVELQTGRMHQIRVHASAIGHPIAGDKKYGDNLFNHQMQKLGLKRLFLHAAALEFRLPTSDQYIHLCAVMDPQLLECLKKLQIA